jgi:hypothetical protein
MKQIAQLTGKLPFAGKHLAKKWFMDGVSGARHGEALTKYANVAALVGFAAIHAVQAKMGFEELAHDEGLLQQGVDVMYASANSLVAYTQAYLAARVALTQERSMGSSGDAVRHRVEMVTPLELGVTLGGQMLFLATTS